MSGLLEEIAKRQQEDPNLSAEQIAREWFDSASSTLAPVAPALSKTEALTQTALGLAATLGRFTLEALVMLVAEDAPSRVQEDVRSGLLRRSRLERATGFHVLKTSTRQSQLQMLCETGVLADILDIGDPLEEARVQAMPSDRRGAILRVLLRSALGGSLENILTYLEDNDLAPLEEVQDALQALTWFPITLAERWGAEFRLQAVRATLTQKLSAAESDRQLATEAAGFVGREPVLDWMTQNVFQKDGHKGTPTILALHGIGGIGKSATLAKFISDQKAARPNLLVGRIDFDRPGFATALPARLSLELIRQIGAQAGISDHNLIANRGYDRGLNLESAVSSRNDSMDQLFELRNQAGRERPFLLVLDTLEERQRHGERTLSQLNYWLNQLASQMPFEYFSVIVAGRAKPNVREYKFLPHQARAMDELTFVPPERQALLTQLGHPPVEAEKLARLSGNPLLLHLLSRLVLRSEGTHADDLLGNDAPRMPAEVLQRVVYDRILKHVDEERARVLAYPGLLLREVTPEIIEEVIAPAVLRTKISPQEAYDLFEALRREVWLVDELAYNRVRHRSDMRRLMMQFLASDASVKDVASRVHFHACDFFNKRGNTHEYWYHFAMNGTAIEVMQLLEHEAAAMLDAVKEELEFVPADVSAALRMLAGRDLSDEDISVLPTQLQVNATNELGPSLVESEDLRRAIRLVEATNVNAKELGAWALQARLGLGQGYEPNSGFIRDLTPDIGPLRLATNALAALQRGNLNLVLQEAQRAENAISDFSKLAMDSSVSEEVLEREFDAILRIAIYASIASMHDAEQNRFVEQRLDDLRIIPEFKLTQLFGPQTYLDNISPEKLQLIENMHRLRMLYPTHAIWHTLDIPFKSRFRFVPSDLWMEQVSHLMADASPDERQSWQNILDGFHKRVSSERMDITYLTRDFPASVGAALEEMPAQAQILPMLRGTGYPEHRLPLRFAISEAIHGNVHGSFEIQATLTDLCIRHNRFIPVDLKRGTSWHANTLEAGDEMLVPYLLYADQCGLLPDFALEMAARFPEAEKLGKLSLDLARWAQRLPPPDLSEAANRPATDL